MLIRRSSGHQGIQAEGASMQDVRGAMSSSGFGWTGPEQREPEKRARPVSRDVACDTGGGMIGRAGGGIDNARLLSD